MRKLILGLLIFAVVLIVILISQLAQNPASALVCRAEQGVVTEYSGAGISYSSNVDVELQDATGRTISPSETQDSQTESGISFTSNLYFEGKIGPGSYRVIVSKDGRSIESYDLNVTSGRSPLLTIFCS